jgi:RNase P/RNase MRP subunit p30
MFEDVIRYIDESTSLQTLLFAKKLGMKEVLLLFSTHKDANKGIADALAKKSDLKILVGLDVRAKDAQKFVTKYDILFSLATRDAVENKHVSYYYGAETLDDKDKTHQRGSGLNHILAKMIAEKGKVYCFDFSMLLDVKDKGQVLGRMQQNERFFTKYKTKMILFSFAKTWTEIRSTADRKHFLDTI